MTSISSLSSSASSSIYGSRSTNIISGLASGMDTEAMIENAVSGYQTKIIQLQQQQTVLSWEQEAYRSISDKLVDLSRKYTDYTSDTNLLSSSFFNNAVLTTTSGEFADKVSATGKSDSEILINSVAQLATKARYTTSSSATGTTVVDGRYHVTASDAVDLSSNMEVSTLSGSITLKYGASEYTIDFDELDVIEGTGTDGAVTASDLQKAINKQLGEQERSDSYGELKSLTSFISASVVGDTITFSDKTGAGNSVVISGATGDIKDALGLQTAIDDEGSTITMPADGGSFTKDVAVAEYLAGKTLSVSLNGISKNIEMPDIDTTGMTEEQANAAFAQGLQDATDKAFGAGKITVDFTDSKLTFTVPDDSTLSVKGDSSVTKALGMSENGLTTYMNTGTTMGEIGLFGTDGKLFINGTQLDSTFMDPVAVADRVEQSDGTYTDKDGVALDSEGYRLDDNGKRMQEFDLVINDVNIGTFTQDSSISSVINAINNNDEVNVEVAYSQLTNQFIFSATESGEGGKIEMGGGLATALFGTPDSSSGNYVAGQDAIFQATVNGQTKTFTRTTNTFDMDGLSVTLKDEFNNVERAAGDPPISSASVYDAAFTEESIFTEGEAVSFSSEADADTIVEALKTFVEEYNVIMTEVKKMYGDVPLEQSSGNSYEPLTDEDRSGMSESEIEAYEEKAKTGLLFMDRDLSALYEAMRSAIAPLGMDGIDLKEIGIETAYSDGLTVINLNEEKLRETLATDPDRVTEAFTKSKEEGATTNGLMTNIKALTDKYAASTGAVKGILIEKAGSKYSPAVANTNSIYKEMVEVEEEIELWQDKLSNQVDYYTTQFTNLELLIQEMNSQSSTLSGLTGGY